MTEICKNLSNGKNTITLTQGPGVLRRTDKNFNYDKNNENKPFAFSHQGYRATDLISSDSYFYAPCKIKRIFLGVHPAYAKNVNIAIFETVNPIKCADNIIRDLTFVCVHGGLDIPSGTDFNEGDHFYTQGNEGTKAIHMHIDILAGKISTNGKFDAEKFDKVHDKYEQPYGFGSKVAGLIPEKSLTFDDVFTFEEIGDLKFSSEAKVWADDALVLKTTADVQNCMTDGWYKENNVWYLYEKGIKQTGWKQDSSGSWYFLNLVDGHMHTGWIPDGTKWYFCNPANGIMQAGWVKVNGSIYYLDPNAGGAMVTGSKVIDGIEYSFNSSGALIGNAPSGIKIPEYRV